MIERIYPQKYQLIQEKYKCGSLLAKLIDTWSDEAIQDFFDDNYQPYDVTKDEILNKIHKRILEAKNNHEKVFIAGDYDADGICGTSILVRLMKDLEIPYGFYIPNRLNEGYGLSLERTKQAIEKGYNLFITVDNGVKAYEPLAYCKEKNVDVIVLDHHEIEQNVDCFALFHPQVIKGKCYDLCGAGCAYEVAKTFDIKIDEYSILAMIATISDLVDIRKENRFIVKEGLSYLNQHQMFALNCMLESNDHCNEDTISFNIGPKINAVGRLAENLEVNKVVSFLTSDDPREIMLLNAYIQKTNDSRKEKVKEILNIIKGMDQNDECLFLYHDDFHVGLNGLVANALLNDLHKPIIIAAKRGNLITASGRSPKGIDLMKLIDPMKDYIKEFGGHTNAAGFSFNEEYLDLFINYFHQLKVNEKEIESAVVINKDDLTLDNLKEVFNHRPYGYGVKLPMVMISNEGFDGSKMRNDAHYRWSLSPVFSAITFKWDELYPQYQDKCVLIGDINENIFRGNTIYQLLVKKIESI